MLSSWKSLLSLALAACGVVEAAVLSTRVRGEVGEINGLDLDKRQGSGKVQIGYFANWGVYSDGRNFQPSKIDTSALTHILYSFLDADPNTGALIVADPYADINQIYPGDNQAAGNVFGAVKQVYLLKKQKRTLKTILSIGGWTYSQNGHFGFVTNASLRARFISDCVKYLEDWGMDGIDIDFEYPTAAQKSSFSALINELRAALTAHMNKKGETNPYLVSIAVPAGQVNWVNFDVPAINGALSYWNLMAYDYSGGWDKVAGDQANVYGGVTGFSTEAALGYYLGSGATPSKIALGIPIYGRSFANTAGMYQAFSGVPAGTWEPGIYDYKALPRSGAQVFENSTTVASYSYSSSAREVVSYDTPSIVTKKVAYALSKGLGGCMYWELSADKTGSESLVRTAAASLGSLDNTQNHLRYPGSIYENIRNNMGDPVTTTSTSTSTTTTTTTTTRTTTTTPPTTTTPGTGGCAGVSAWSSAVAYTGGQKVTYGGHLWTAKWWTQADTPGGAAGVWTDGGAC